MARSRRNPSLDHVSVHTEQDEESAANAMGPVAQPQDDVLAQNPPPPPPPVGGPVLIVGNELMMTFIQGVMTQMTQVTEFLKDMQTARMQEPIQARRGEHRDTDDRVGRVISDLARQRPPVFEGSTEPTDFVHWITRMEKLFDMIRCPEELKVSVAAYYLEKSAHSYWESRKPAGRDATWREFREILEERFYPAPLRDLKLRELLNPEINENEDVAKAAETYHALLPFAGRIIETERDKIKYFSLRLKPRIRTQLVSHNCATLQQYIDRALELELMLKDVAKKSDSHPSKKQKTHGNFDRSKNMGFQKPQSYAAQSGKDAQHISTMSEAVTQPQGSRQGKRCFNCGQVGHIGRECPRTSVICYNCGGEGHIAAACKRQNPEQTIVASNVPRGQEGQIKYASTVSQHEKGK